MVAQHLTILFHCFLFYVAAECVGGTYPYGGMERVGRFRRFRSCGEWTRICVPSKRIAVFRDRVLCINGLMLMNGSTACERHTFCYQQATTFQVGLLLRTYNPHLRRQALGSMQIVVRYWRSADKRVRVDCHLFFTAPSLHGVTLTTRCV